jgi:hypothetical protein
MILSPEDGEQELETMTLPPGAEDIDHSGYRIEIRHHGSGYKAFIYAPGSILSFSDIPNGPDRDAVIAEAKALVGTAISGL